MKSAWPLIRDRPALQSRVYKDLQTLTCISNQHSFYQQTDARLQPVWPPATRHQGGFSEQKALHSKIQAATPKHSCGRNVTGTFTRLSNNSNVYVTFRHPRQLIQTTSTWRWTWMPGVSTNPQEHLYVMENGKLTDENEARMKVTHQVTNLVFGSNTYDSGCLCSKKNHHHDTKSLMITFLGRLFWEEKLSEGLHLL